MEASRVLRPDERREDDGRRRGLFDRECSPHWRELVGVTVRRIEVDLLARRFGGARAAIESLENEESNPCEVNDDTPLSETFIASHMRMLNQLEKLAGVMTVGDVRRKTLIVIKHTRGLGDDCVRVLRELLESIDGE